MASGSNNYVLSVTVDNLASAEKLFKAIQGAQEGAKKPIIQTIDINTDRADAKVKRLAKDLDRVTKKGVTMSTGGSGGVGGTIQVKLQSKALEQKLEALVGKLHTSIVGKGATRQQVLTVKVVDGIKFDTTKLDASIMKLNLAAGAMADAAKLFNAGVNNLNTGRGNVSVPARLAKTQTAAIRGIMSDFNGERDSVKSFTELRNKFKAARTGILASLKNAGVDPEDIAKVSAQANLEIMANMAKMKLAGNRSVQVGATKEMKGTLQGDVIASVLNAGLTKAFQQGLKPIIANIPQMMAAAMVQSQKEVADRTLGLFQTEIGDKRGFLQPVNTRRRAQLMDMKNRAIAAERDMASGRSPRDEGTDELGIFLRSGAATSGSLAALTGKQGILNKLIGKNGKELGVGVAPTAGSPDELRFFMAANKSIIAAAQVAGGGNTVAHAMKTMTTPFMAMGSGAINPVLDVTYYNKLLTTMQNLGDVKFTGLIGQFTELAAAVNKLDLQLKENPALTGIMQSQLGLKTIEAKRQEIVDALAAKAAVRAVTKKPDRDLQDLMARSTRFTASSVGAQTALQQLEAIHQDPSLGWSREAGTPHLTGIQDINSRKAINARVATVLARLDAETGNLDFGGRRVKDIFASHIAAANPAQPTAQERLAAIPGFAEQIRLIIATNQGKLAMSVNEMVAAKAGLPGSGKTPGPTDANRQMRRDENEAYAMERDRARQISLNERGTRAALLQKELERRQVEKEAGAIRAPELVKLLGSPNSSAAFFELLRKQLTGLSTNVAAVDRMGYEVNEQGAAGMSGQQRINARRMRAAAAAAGQTGILGLLANSGDLGIPGIEPLQAHARAVQDIGLRRQQMAAALFPVTRADEIQKDPSASASKKAQWAAHGAAQAENLKKLGITKTALDALINTEEHAKAALMDTAAGFSAQNTALMQNKGFISDFLHKLRQLSIYAGAGMMVYGAVQSVRALFTEYVRLEAQLTRIQGILGESGTGSRNEMFGGLMKIATQFGVDVNKAAQTFQAFAQAGFNRQEALRETRAALAAQIGGGLDAATAENTAIAVQTISGGHISSQDIFSRIARIEATTPVKGQDLAEGITKLGALFRDLQPNNLGMTDSYDTLMAAMTHMIETTRVSGAVAATSLKFIVSRLTAPAVARTLQNKFGIMLGDESGNNLRPVQDILQDVAAKYQELSAPGPHQNTAMASRLIQTVAGNRQIAQAVALFTNFDRVLELATESASAFGDVQRRTTLQMETLEQHTQQLKNAFQSAAGGILERSGAMWLAKAAAYAGTKTLEGVGAHPMASLLGTSIGLPVASIMGGKLSNWIRGKQLAGALALDMAQPARMAAIQGFETAAGSAGIIPQGMGLGTASLATSGTVSVFGRLMGALGSALAGISIVAAIAGLFALGGIIKGIIAAQERLKHLYDIAVPTAQDIANSDAGKEFAQTAATFDMGPGQLSVRMEQIHLQAQRRLYTQGPNGEAAPYSQTQVEGILASTKFDPHFYNQYRKALVDEARGPQGLPGLEGRTTEEVQALIDQLSRSVLQLSDATVHAAEANLRITAQARLSDLTTRYDAALRTENPERLQGAYRDTQVATMGGAARWLWSVIQGIASTGATPGAAGASGVESYLPGYSRTSQIGSLTYTDLLQGVGGPKQALTSALRGAYGFENTNTVDFSGIHTYQENLATGGGKASNLLDTILATMSSKSLDFNTALTETVNTLYRFNPAVNTLAQVNRNTAALTKGFIREWNATFDIDALGKVVRRTQGADGSIISGEAFMMSTRADAFRKAAEQKIAALPANLQAAATANLRRGEGALGPSANREKFFADFIKNNSGFGLVRDRLLDIMGQFYIRNEQISILSGAGGRTGRSLNVAADRLSSTEQANDQLAAVGAQIQVDYMKARSKYRNMLGDTLDETPAARFDQEQDVSPSSAALQHTRELFSDANKNSPEALRAQRMVDIAKAAASYTIQNQPLFAVLTQDQQDMLAKYTGMTAEVAFNNMPTLLRIMYEVEGVQARITLAQQHANNLQETRNMLVAAQLQTTQRIAQLYRTSEMRRAERVSRPFSTVGMALQNVRADAQDSRTRALLARAQAEQTLQDQINNNSFKGRASEEREKADVALRKTLIDVNQQEILSLRQTLLDAQDRLADQLAGAMQQAIESAARGFTDVFGSYDSLTRGRERFDIPKRNFDLPAIAGRLITPVGESITQSTVSGLSDQLFGPGGLLNKSLGNLVGTPVRIRYAQMEADLLYSALFTGGQTVEQAIINGFQAGLAGMAGGTGVAGGASAAPDVANMTAAQRRIALRRAAAMGLPVGLATGLSTKLALRDNTQMLNEMDFALRYPNLAKKGITLSNVGNANVGLRSPKSTALGSALNMGAMLAGNYGGAALGEWLGKGRYSYASTGSAIGSSMGAKGLAAILGKTAFANLRILGGPLGALAGGLLGGILGGLFGKKPPKVIEQLSVLERIERNTRGTVTALENQNRQLFNLDSRLLNVPSGFSVPGYRPVGVGAGANAMVQNNQQYTFNIQSSDPEGVRREIETILREDSRKFGVFSSARY